MNPLKLIICSLLVTLHLVRSFLLFGNASCNQDFDSYCSKSCLFNPFFFRTDLMHTEGKGVGFQNGYTTLDFFFMSSAGSFYPFVDLRGHGFDNRKLAANGGIGFRWEACSEWIFGGNIYFDFRQGDHRDYDRMGHGFEQIGCGFEALSPYLDLRLNCYYPIGKKNYHFKQIIFNDGDITPIFLSKSQSTMKGANIEAGLNLAKGSFCQNNVDWSIYAACGPYYFDQESGGGRWGGELRIKADLTRYLFFEIEMCYDRVCQFATQWRIGIDIPLYPWISGKIGKASIEKACCSCWAQPWQLREIVVQPVKRMEIIPLNHKKR